MTKATGNDAPKAIQILRGAKSAFVELGFEGTSVDEIARRAGVSKATLYSHFDDKKAIFIAFIQTECQKQVARLLRVETTEHSVKDALRRIAREYVGFLLSSYAMEMFRLIVAEVQRFPEIGQTFFESGPQQAIHRLAHFLSEANSRGELRIPDAHVAAHQFAALCRGELFYHWLLGIKTKVTQQEIDDAAEIAVTTFLNAFRIGEET